MAGSTRIRRFVAPLSIDAVSVLAGGYAINELTGDEPSQWWWALAAGSAVVLVASGAWKLWIERRHSEPEVPTQASTASNEVSGGTSNNVASSADTGNTSIANGGVSISAKNNSFAAWNVNGTVNLGGSSQPKDVESHPRSTEDR